ncbi:hypothetical protein [Streptomyces sp. NPDC006784]|uniref:hypothetical protein n=1 Tax=Streptomyces sp. NPDC006784 TaxID=3364764 RepID=UPI0036BFFF8A
MPKYTVPLTGYANIAVTVETDETDPEAIAELAQEQVYVSLCHQCGGHTNSSLEVGDEWEAVRREHGTPEVTKE